MVGAHIEELQPAVALSGPRPQGAEPITFARVRDVCSMQLGQLARRAQFLCARRKIDQRLKQVPG